MRKVGMILLMSTSKSSQNLNNPHGRSEGENHHNTFHSFCFRGDTTLLLVLPDPNVSRLRCQRLPESHLLQISNPLKMEPTERLGRNMIEEFMKIARPDLGSTSPHAKTLRPHRIPKGTAPDTTRQAYYWMAMGIDRFLASYLLNTEK